MSHPRLTTMTAIRPAKRPIRFERRESCRFHTVMRLARVEREEDVGLWRVRNISDEGMMMLTGVGAAPGEPLTIGLSETVSIQGRAIWWDGQRCGVSFDRRVDCADLLHRLMEEQKAPGYRPLRLQVATRAVACCEDGLHTVRVIDVSQHGAGLLHNGHFHAGMRTKLMFESGDEHRGVVRWVTGDRAGIYLTEPFPGPWLESARRI